jgi:hypothetical protein
MSAVNFAVPSAVFLLALATIPPSEAPSFCWHVRCALNEKCVVPPNYNPTVDYPAPTVPYSVWYNECFTPHCAGKPSGTCE